MASLTATSATWATLPLRIALGLIMFAHGAQKVFGIWGGRGLNAWISGIAPLSLRPSWFWLSAAAFAEFVGGALILIGLFTRPAAFLIACDMVVAMFGVHWGNGFFLTQGGYEFTLALLGISLALVFIGGGNASVDSQMSR